MKTFERLSVFDKKKIIEPLSIFDDDSTILVIYTLRLAKDVFYMELLQHKESVWFVLESVARFIEFMQKPTGEFNGKYNKVSGMSDFVSLYYPGEASLGLMKLYQKTKNQKWFEIALKGLKFLADLRQNQKTSDVLPDHWALISTREILKAPVLLQSDKRLLIRHAQKVINELNFSI